MTFEGEDRFLSMATSAVCGTALAAAMFYFLRDAIRQYEDEDRAEQRHQQPHKSIAEICNNPDLTIAAASIRINEFLRTDATLRALRIGVDVLSDVDSAVNRIVDTDADRLRAVRNRLRLCVERIDELAHLRALVARRKAIKYDTSNSEHETLLLALWKALKRDEPLAARVSRQWGAIGFQGSDPATDFRGMGILGLEQLHFFASRHTAEAAHALELSLGDGSPLSGFPFAITGINVTALMVNALNDGRLDRELLLRGPDREQFDMLYAQTMATFAREYTASKPDNIASFPPFFAAFSQRLESVVDSP